MTCLCSKLEAELFDEITTDEVRESAQSERMSTHFVKGQSPNESSSESSTSIQRHNISCVVREEETPPKAKYHHRTIGFTVQSRFDYHSFEILPRFKSPAAAKGTRSTVAIEVT